MNKSMKQIWGPVFLLIGAGLSSCTVNMGTNSADSSVTTGRSNNVSPSPSASGEATAKPVDQTANPAKKTDEPTERTGGERVKFSAGENSANLTRDIPANGSIDFLINARKGQPMGLQIGYEGKASDISGYLSEPGLQDLAMSLPPETRKEFAVKASGDHRLTVSNNSGKKVTFTLYVDIY